MSIHTGSGMARHISSAALENSFSGNGRLVRFLREHKWATPVNRSFRCNGELLRFFRDLRGMTQRQLALEAGYSVRLVGKAEAGEPIREETVEVLAQTLSHPQQPISPIDLISDPIALAKEYNDALSLQKKQFESQVSNLIARDFQLRVVADFERLGLRSLYCGINGLCEYYDHLRSLSNGLNVIVDAAAPQFFALGNEVLVWHRAILIEPRGDSLFRPTTKLRFSEGRLVEQEDRISRCEAVTQVCRRLSTTTI